MRRLQLEIEIPAVEHEETRTATLKKIRNTICALQNSGGGTLKFICDQDTPKLADDILRRVEELYREVWTTMETQKNCKIREQTSRSLTLDIQGSSKLVTLNYNIFLPTETQVLQVRHSSEVRRIIERKVVEVKKDKDKEPQDFVSGRSCGLRESQTVQFKLLTAKTEGHTTFYDRVKKSLARYVSAFANHRGGRIYYGINDDGVVEGEDIGIEDHDELRVKIVNYIKQMKCSGPGRLLGDFVVTVDFKPVESTEEPTKFVMVVCIPTYTGAVFAAVPESYFIPQPSVTERREISVLKMKFDNWLILFRVPEQPWPTTFIPHPHIPRIGWSTPEARKIYLDFTTKLVQCRNDNNTEGFCVLERLANDERYKRSCAPLVVKAEKVAVEYKKCNFDEAASLLDDFSRFIEKANDSGFHKVKVLYLRSRIERSRGNYKESYKIAQRFINMRIETIPAEFISVWFYMHIGMLANILAIEERAPNLKKEKFDIARKMLTLAATDASTLDDVPTGFPDLHQKLQIYQAMVLLRCSLTGQVSAELVTREDIDRATKVLCKVCSSYMNGEFLTHYRKIQLLFGQSCVFLRRSQLPYAGERKKREYLRRALILAKEAEGIARECDFQDMVGYANKFQQLITL